MGVFGFILGVSALVCAFGGSLGSIFLLEDLNKIANSRGSSSTYRSLVQEARGMFNGTVGVMVAALLLGIGAIVISSIFLKRPGTKPIKILGLIFGIISVTAASIVLFASVGCACSIVY